MGAKNRAYDRFLSTGENTDRIQFFSDAVFAIAMTLLVIGISVPIVRDGPLITDNMLTNELWPAIGAQWHQFLAYAISFWVIGVSWASHHRRFRVTKRFDGHLISLNLLLLFFIAFLPYPTTLLSEYAGAIPAVVLYASIVSIISLLQCAQWVYSHHKGFLDERVDVGMYRYLRRNILVTPAVFLLSIPVALIFGGETALFFWIVSWPASVLVDRYEPKVAVPPVSEASA